MPTTGIPMRNTDFINNPFALADPVPLTVAILMMTSLILDTIDTLLFESEVLGLGFRWERLREVVSPLFATCPPQLRRERTG